MNMTRGMAFLLLMGLTQGGFLKDLSAQDGKDKAERVRCKAAGLEIEALYRHPGGEKRPAVIYNHGKEVELKGYAAAGGYDVADFVDQWARDGYAALAPLRPSKVTRFSDWREMIVKGIAFLQAQPGVDPNRIYVIGFSKGGLLSLQVAIEEDRDLAGLILMSPSSGEGENGWKAWATPENLRKIGVPVLVTLGGKETGEIPANVRQFVKDMITLGKKTEFKVYDVPRAIHRWFHRVREEYWRDIGAWLASRATTPRSPKEARPT